MRPWSAGLVLAALAGPACAQTDFTALTPRERAVFHEQIRAVLRMYPELVRQRPELPGYDDDIASDLELIARNSAALFTDRHESFGPVGAAQKIALITSSHCPDCAAAEADLRLLSTKHDLQVFVIDAQRNDDLARRLGVDTLPFYVMPKMMLRGHVPRIVLEHYLAAGTGQ